MQFSVDILIRPTMVCVSMLAMATSAQAARPLAVDDTGVNESGVCHLEAWQDRNPAGRHTLVAPTCGVGGGLEINLEAVHSHPGEDTSRGAFIGFRWAPAHWQLGEWKFATRGGWTQEKSSEGGRWSSSDWSLGMMASRPLSDQVTLLLNLGHTHLIGQGEKTTTHGVALVWAPHERWQLFAEALGEGQRRPDLGAGVRHWVIPEVLGLDLTVSRPPSRDGQTTWGVGFGWYGLKF